MGGGGLECEWGGKCPTSNKMVIIDPILSERLARSTGMRSRNSRQEACEPSERGGQNGPFQARRGEGGGGRVGG